MSKPHVHAEMIKQWADDPSRAVECFRPGWSACWMPVHGMPSWATNCLYRFADDPANVSPPPRKVAYTRRVEVPAPLTEMLESGRIWTPYVRGGSANVELSSVCTSLAIASLESGAAYATREEAQARAEAMVLLDVEEE